MCFRLIFDLSLACLIILIMWESFKKFVVRHRKKIIYTLAGLATVSVLGYLTFDYYQNNKEVKLSTFLKALNGNYVEQVVLEGSDVYFRSTQQEAWYHTFAQDFPKELLYGLLRKKGVTFTQEKHNSDQYYILALKEVMLALTSIYLIRQIQKGPSSDVNLKPKVYENDTSFNDIYGGQIIKSKMREVISFLNDPSRFEKFGARIRRGLLLYGPPGTGKTMLARALANEARCNFIKMAASEFQEMYVGVGPKRVRELFKEARACKQGCIIYVDELDALGTRMNADRDSHQTTSTITQFLSQMDGFSSLDKVVVVASTNRIDLIDQAVLRAGRFDIKIQVPLPSREERLGILKLLTQKKLKRHSIDQQTMKIISERTQGCCGADLEAMINEAVYKAIRLGQNEVNSENIRTALDQMIIRRV